LAQDWGLKAHTEAKHKILRHYLGAWFAIMAEAGFEKRFIFLDGFAGPGRYDGGEPGSPLIALEVLLDHPFFPRWKGIEFLFLFVESDPDNFRNLGEELEAFWAARGGQPDNVKVGTFHGTFEEAAEDILKGLEGKSLAPTFAFVDPFGWKGLPLQLITKLLAYKKCEVFVNFMVEQAVRFCKVSSVQESFQALFGTTDEHVPPPGAERGEYLIALYRKQLKDVAGFTYVIDFQMIDHRNKTLYHLFYGTKSLTGLDRMKQAMWKVDPGGGVRFSDRLAGALVLFGEKPDPMPLIAALRSLFARKTVSVEVVVAYVVELTPYASNHYNRNALSPMEKEGLIEVVSSTRKRRYSFPPGTKIRFL
jgi:three-Cys-motif partner protein